MPNLITGSGNFTDGAEQYLIGSASWTGSTTRDELYVQGQFKTDIFYDVGGTSSLFLAKMNFSGSGEGYTYDYTGALSGSVTNLQEGTFADYYINTFWGARGDILYTYDPVTTRSIDDGGQWTDTVGGPWKTGYKIAFLYRKSDAKIVSMCAVYPVSRSASEAVEYVTPGVNGYFTLLPSGTSYSTDLIAQGAGGNPKAAELRFIADNGVLATTNDPPPAPPEPEVTFSVNPQIFRFSGAIMLPP